MLYLAFGNAKIQRYWRYVVAFFGAVFIYNQAPELNHGFYMDYQEYEHEKEILIEAVYDVQSQYGSEVPIVLTGSYDIPYEFVEHSMLLMEPIENWFSS